MTYDVVRHIGIIRYRRSNLQHRRLEESDSESRWPGVILDGFVNHSTLQLQANRHLEPCQTRYRGFPDIGSPTDTISGLVSRYQGFLLTRYRDMLHVTRYRVPISGTYPISGYYVTDIVYDMISRYRYQYRVPISGVPISGYDNHRYRSEYGTRYRVLFLVFHGPCAKAVGSEKIW